MNSVDWETERLFVLETVKRIETETYNNSRSINDFKTEITAILAVIQTKLALYSFLGSIVVSATVSTVIKFTLG